MRSQKRDEDAESLLDWKEMDCSLVETSSEGICSEYAGLMRWEGQATVEAYASGEAETYSFCFIEQKEKASSPSLLAWGMKLSC